jgi:opacity protein-like surface antigen
VNKSIGIFLLTVLALGAPLAGSRADDGGSFALPPGPYFAAGAGGDWIDNSSVTFFGSKEDTRWAGGFGGFAALGYRFGYGVRAELEGSGRQDLVHAFNNSPWYGTQWDTSLMANLFYDLSTGTRFVPYLGGGMGMSHLSWGNNFRANLNALPYTYDDSGTEFAWQGIAGLAYHLTRKLAITTDFRIKGSSGYKFSSSGPATTDITRFDYMTRSLFVGLRYSFD